MASDSLCVDVEIPVFANGVHATAFDYRSPTAVVVDGPEARDIRLLSLLDGSVSFQVCAPSKVRFAATMHSLDEGQFVCALCQPDRAKAPTANPLWVWRVSDSALATCVQVSCHRNTLPSAMDASKSQNATLVFVGDGYGPIVHVCDIKRKRLTNVAMDHMKSVKARGAVASLVCHPTRSFIAVSFAGGLAMLFDYASFTSSGDGEGMGMGDMAGASAPTGDPGAAGSGVHDALRPVMRFALPDDGQSPIIYLQFHPSVEVMMGTANGGRVHVWRVGVEAVRSKVRNSLVENEATLQAVANAVAASAHGDVLQMVPIPESPPVGRSRPLHELLSAYFHPTYPAVVVLQRVAEDGLPLETSQRITRRLMLLCLLEPHLRTIASYLCSPTTQHVACSPNTNRMIPIEAIPVAERFDLPGGVGPDDDAPRGGGLFSRHDDATALSAQHRSAVPHAFRTPQQTRRLQLWQLPVNDGMLYYRAHALVHRPAIPVQAFTGSSEAVPSAPGAAASNPVPQCFFVRSGLAAPSSGLGPLRHVPALYRTNVGSSTRHKFIPKRHLWLPGMVTKQNRAPPLGADLETEDSASNGQTNDTDPSLRRAGDEGAVSTQQQDRQSHATPRRRSSATLAQQDVPEGPQYPVEFCMLHKGSMIGVIYTVIAPASPTSSDLGSKLVGQIMPVPTVAEQPQQQRRPKQAHEAVRRGSKLIGPSAVNWPVLPIASICETVMPASEQQLSASSSPASNASPHPRRVKFAAAGDQNAASGRNSTNPFSDDSMDEDSFVGDDGTDEAQMETVLLAVHNSFRKLMFIDPNKGAETGLADVAGAGVRKVFSPPMDHNTWICKSQLILTWCEVQNLPPMELVGGVQPGDQLLCFASVTETAVQLRLRGADRSPAFVRLCEKETVLQVVWQMDPVGAEPTPGTPPTDASLPWIGVLTNARVMVLDVHLCARACAWFRRASDVFAAPPVVGLSVLWLGAALLYSCSDGTVRYLISGAGLPEPHRGLRAPGDHLSVTHPTECGELLCTFPGDVCALRGLTLVAALPDRLVVAVRSERGGGVQLLTKPFFPLEPLVLATLAAVRPARLASDVRLRIPPHIYEVLRNLVSQFTPSGANFSMTADDPAKPTAAATTRVYNVLMEAGLPDLASLISAMPLTISEGLEHRFPPRPWLAVSTKFTTAVQLGRYDEACNELLAKDPGWQESFNDPDSLGSTAFPHRITWAAGRLRTASHLLSWAGQHESARRIADMAGDDVHVASVLSAVAHCDSAGHRDGEVIEQLASAMEECAPALAETIRSAALPVRAAASATDSGGSKGSGNDQHEDERTRTLAQHPQLLAGFAQCFGTKRRPSVLPLSSPLEVWSRNWETMDSEYQINPNDAVTVFPRLRLDLEHLHETWHTHTRASHASHLASRFSLDLLAADSVEDWVGTSFPESLDPTVNRSLSQRLQLGRNVSEDGAEDTDGIEGPSPHSRGNSKAAAGGADTRDGVKADADDGDASSVPWLAGIGQSREPEQNVVGYWRFGDSITGGGADDSNAAGGSEDGEGEPVALVSSDQDSPATRNFRDLSKQSTVLELFGQCPKNRPEPCECATTEESSSPVDPGEGSTRRAFDVVFSPSATSTAGAASTVATAGGKPAHGLRIAVRRGSQCDIGLHHEESSRCCMTLEMWVRKDGEPMQEDAVIAMRSRVREQQASENGTVSSSGGGRKEICGDIWRLLVTPEGALVLQLGEADRTGGDTKRVKTEDGVVPSLTHWNHIALVLDGREQQLSGTVSVKLATNGHVVCDRRDLQVPMLSDEELAESFLYILPNGASWRMTELRVWALLRSEESINDFRENHLDLAEEKKRLTFRIKNRSRAMTTASNSPNAVGDGDLPPLAPGLPGVNDGASSAPLRARRRATLLGPGSVFASTPAGSIAVPTFTPPATRSKTDLSVAARRRSSGLLAAPPQKGQSKDTAALDDSAVAESSTAGPCGGLLEAPTTGGTGGSAAARRRRARSVVATNSPSISQFNTVHGGNIPLPSPQFQGTPGGTGSAGEAATSGSGSTASPNAVAGGAPRSPTNTSGRKRAGSALAVVQEALDELSDDESAAAGPSTSPSTAIAAGASNAGGETAGPTSMANAKSDDIFFASPRPNHKSTRKSVSFDTAPKTVTFESTSKSVESEGEAVSPPRTPEDDTTLSPDSLAGSVVCTQAICLLSTTAAAGSHIATDLRSNILQRGAQLLCMTGARGTAAQAASGDEQQQCQGEPFVAMVRLRHPVAATTNAMRVESAILAPLGGDERVIAMFARNQICVQDLNRRQRIAELPVKTPLVYWAWVAKDRLHLVTATSVFDWHVGHASRPKPTKLFDRTDVDTNLSGSTNAPDESASAGQRPPWNTRRVCGYRATSDGWIVLMTCAISRTEDFVCNSHPQRAVCTTPVPAEVQCAVYHAPSRRGLTLEGVDTATVVSEPAALSYPLLVAVSAGRSMAPMTVTAPRESAQCHALALNLSHPSVEGCMSPTLGDRSLQVRELSVASHVWTCVLDHTLSQQETPRAQELFTARTMAIPGTQGQALVPPAAFVVPLPMSAAPGTKATGGGAEALLPLPPPESSGSSPASSRGSAGQGLLHAMVCLCTGDVAVLDILSGALAVALGRARQSANACVASAGIEGAEDETGVHATNSAEYGRFWSVELLSPRVGDSQDSGGSQKNSAAPPVVVAVCAPDGLVLRLEACTPCVP